MPTLARSVLVVLALLAGGPSLAAQDLRYASETDVEFGGALGVMMRLVPGGGATRETTSIKGARMRLDSGEETSFIDDLAAGRMTSLDHEAKTYTVFSMDQIPLMLEQMRASAEAAETGAVPLRDEETGAEGEVEIRVSTDPTNERRTIQGLDARRVFLTLEFEGRVMVPEEEGGSGEMEEAGTVVLFTDLWLAEPFPEVQALAEANRERAAELVESARESGAAMGRVLSANPDLAVAMEQQADELAALEGMAVESSSYLVGVPPGKSFDRAKALEFATRSLGSQVAGAAANQAREAVGRAAGRLGGLLGRGRREEPEEPELEQGVLFRVRTRITSVERASIPDSAFEIPAGYREQPLEVPR